MTHNKKTLKFQMMMAPSEAAELDSWMFQNQIRSRAEAIRRLCRAALDSTPDSKPVDLTAMAKSMLSIWDRWMNVEAIDRTTERQATDLLKAACYAGVAYDDAMSAPLSADNAPAALLRVFLIALVDWKSPELNPYRTQNWSQADTPANASTQPFDVAAVRDTAFSEGIEAAARYHNHEAEYYEARQGSKDGVPFPIVAGWHRLDAQHVRALSPTEPVPVPLPQDVINLVIAARELVYSGAVRTGVQEGEALDKALEAFASRVPWDNEPDNDDTCIICGIAPVDGDMVYHELGEGGFIHAACCTSTIESFTDENCNPLKEGAPIPAPFAYESEKTLLAKSAAAPNSEAGR